MSKSAKKRAQAAARRLPTHMQDVAFTKRTAAAERKHRSKKLGTFGAASEVRRIDPAEYEASKERTA